MDHGQPRHPSRHPAIALIAASLMSACQAQPGVPADEAALLVHIRDEIGEARCDADADCRTLAIGHKACGGPQQWWAWSTRDARAEPLEAWSAELARLQRQRQEAEGRVSNCALVPDPGTRCEARRCVLRGTVDRR